MNGISPKLLKISLETAFFLSRFSFTSQTFTNHRTAKKWGDNFFNFSIPLSSASKTFKN